MATMTHRTTLGITSVQSSNFNVDPGAINRVDFSGGNIVATLPPAADCTNKTIKIFATSGSPDYTCQVDGYGSETIDSLSSIYLGAAPYTSEFFSDGTEWYWLKTGQVYVDRGNLIAADYRTNDGNLTADSTNQTKDLSAIVSIAATNGDTKTGIILCNIYLDEGSTGTKFFRVFSGANSNDVYSLHAVAVPDTQVWSQGFVGCSSSRGIKYFITSGADGAWFNVIGWMVDV